MAFRYILWGKLDTLASMKSPGTISLFKTTPNDLTNYTLYLTGIITSLFVMSYDTHPVRVHVIC